MTCIKVYNNEILLGSFEILIQPYQPVPFWPSDTYREVMSNANEKFGLEWTHLKIENLVKNFLDLK